MEDFFKIFGRFFKIKVKIIKYRLHLDVWKLQSGKMIMETECVRFAKFGGFFNNFERIFQKIDIKVIIIDVWKSRKRLVIYVSLQMSCKVLLRQLIIHDFINLYLIELDHF